MTTAPYIVGIGGTTSPGSSTEQALMLALASAEREGARVRLFGGADIVDLPHYAYGVATRHEGASALVQAVREADGLALSLCY